MQPAPIASSRRLTAAPLPLLPPCRRIIWVDSKKFRVTPGKLSVIGARGSVLEVIEHPMLSSGGKASVTINYYAAVNAELGAVAIRFVTGTTGLRRKYKVRTCCLGVMVCAAAAAACPPPPSAPRQSSAWWVACSCCCT